MVMRSLFALFLLLLLMHSAFAQLKPEDILIIREEVTKIVKTENDARETRMREYVDLKFDVQDTKFDVQDTKFEGLSRQITMVVILVIGLIALIVVAIGITQIIIARKQRGQESLEAEIRTLREKVELLEQTRLIGPN